MSARVLVVDDILPNVKLLEAKLSGEYYNVLTATNGEEALKKIAEDAPDLVLLDVMMPGMDGFEVCRRIKSNPDMAHIPVVMVTALTDPQERVRGLEAGADDFLSKPVSDLALMARVRSLVRLKMTVDEWRVRETTATQFGVMGGGASVMKEPVENARVLLIEDQDFEVNKFAEMLGRDSDRVDTAATGAQAMAFVGQGGEYDLIVLSLNLSGEDGLRLCAHLRSNEKTRSAPILMVGSEEDMPRIAHGLEIGAHDYILRPVDRNEFLARARTQIRRKRFQGRLRSNYETSLSMALTDSLTGLYNRRYLEVHLQKLLEKTTTLGKPFGVLMMDIDFFKKVNDNHGHNVGDEVLKEFARRIADNLRSFDLVARTGGEEFVAILPDISEERAKFVAERLRRSIADTPFACGAQSGCLSISTSVGGVVVSGGNHTTADILKRADVCLYEAKNSGRNGVVFEGTGRLNPDDYRQEERTLGE